MVDLVDFLESSKVGTSPLKLSMLNTIYFIPPQSIPPQRYCHRDLARKPLSRSKVSTVHQKCQGLNRRSLHTVVIWHKSSQPRIAIVFAPGLQSRGVKLIHFLPRLGVERDVHWTGFRSIGVRIARGIFSKHEIGDWSRTVRRSE
jgi:hypothetical protein